MMTLAASLCLALQSHWPVATPDNGYSAYIAAAQLAEGPAWKGFVYKKPGAKPMTVLRGEALQAGPLLKLIKKANRLRVYYPVKEETYATLYPELAGCKKATSIACDAASAKAMTGDLDGASEWLAETQRFADRLPSGNLLRVLVRESMISRLRSMTRVLLPKLGPYQLKAQLQAVENVAQHFPDLRNVAANEKVILGRSIRLFVTQPEALGIPDETPDVAAAFEQIYQLKLPSKEVQITIAKLGNEAPESVRSDPEAAIKYLTDAEPKVPDAQREEYRDFIKALHTALQPKTTSLRAQAKAMLPDERAHAEKIMHLQCDTPIYSLADALARPQAQWGLEFKGKDYGDNNAQVMADGKALKYVSVDMYAIKLADVLNNLGTLGTTPTPFCRYELQQLELARLHVIEVKLWLYRAKHHHFPKTLDQIGVHRDPTTKLPYTYKRMVNGFQLAAEHIPGIGRVSYDSKAQTPY